MTTHDDLRAKALAHLSNYDDSGSTHWDGCEATHWRCCMAALLDEIEALRADAKRYRFLRDDKSNSLHLSRNGDHAANYQTAQEWIEQTEPNWFADDPPEEIAAMKETNTIWTLQIYPDTPIGFYKWNAATLDAAIDRAAQSAQGEKG